MRVQCSLLSREEGRSVGRERVDARFNSDVEVVSAVEAVYELVTGRVTNGPT